MSRISEIAQTSDTGAPVYLYRLDLGPLGGPVYHFTPGPLNGASVRFGGIEYKPMPIRLTGLGKSGKKAPPRPRLTLANAKRDGAQIVVAWGSLKGAIVTRVETRRAHLDGQPEADPGATFPAEVWIVDRMASGDPSMIEWELTAATDVAGVQLPRRQINRDTCSRIYRRWTGDGWDRGGHDPCPFAGGGMYDATNAVVTDPAKDQCNHAVSGCERRFGKGAVLPGRFFPGARTK